MADRFYVNCRLTPGEVALHGPEAHHLATVLRARPGDVVCLFNGDGAEYPAVIVEAGRSAVILRVTNREAPPREVGYRLEVAAPLPKGDRGDFLVEKLTELGVTDFVPLRTERTVVHPRDSRLDKLRRTVIEASKQCGRNVLMQIGSLTAWDEYCGKQGLPQQRRLAHPGSALPLPARSASEGRDRVLAVGPEGGFTDDEVDLAVATGWQIVNLGPRILRVETAAIALVVQAISLP
ncbi:MAG TPA: RsmE family RNA methyltransferase [Gemmataceae bacterium]|jgi:16S rRNA (uracil1498-N3)-methyltransferase|nr:RsmE family RNA methyltransferase [Gemmataceae bacterium]